MSNKIHTPNLRALRYKGDFSKKLFEVRADKLPILEKGDFVIVDKMSSVSLKRRGLFEEVEISDVFVDENKVSFVPKELTDEELIELVEVLTDRGILKTQSLVSEQENQDDNETIVLKELTEFGDDKDALEVYGKEFVIDLDKRENIESMYEELEAFVQALNSDKIPAVPSKKDIDTLSDDDIKKWCTHFGITIGRKQVTTLKGLLLPFLLDDVE